MRAPLAVASLQQALYTRITTDCGISVYCPLAPDTAELPLVAIPEFYMSDFGTKTDDTWKVTYTISVWTGDEMSFDTLTTRCNSVVQAIMRDNLDLTNDFKEIDTVMQSFTCRSEAVGTGIAQHGTMQFISVVQDIS